MKSIIESIFFPSVLAQKSKHFTVMSADAYAENTKKMHGPTLYTKLLVNWFREGHFNIDPASSLSLFLIRLTQFLKILLVQQSTKQRFTFCTQLRFLREKYFFFWDFFFFFFWERERESFFFFERERKLHPP